MEWRKLSDKKPYNLHFGTTSWLYPGWKGLVYFGEYNSAKEFKKKALIEYFRIPVFDFVEVDYTYYTYPKFEQLSALDESVPCGKNLVFKITREVFSQGIINADLFKDNFLRNFTDSILSKTSFFHIQFSWFAKFDVRLLDNVIQFREKVKLPLSVEFRNVEALLYLNKLVEAGITPCINHWSFMPKLRDQLQHLNLSSVVDIYIRLLTPLNVTYEEAVSRFSPYDQLKEFQVDCREDLVNFIRTNKSINTWIAVNNRFEGCAPLTVIGILNSLNGR
ncbi:MAG: DUF72 domain-containing protein [Deltaproteobacteria bacterium]|nr:DUF72 domain-containing protein [Deltaproteobacteria bacterium]